MKAIPPHAPELSLADLNAARRANLFLARRERDWGLFIHPTSYGEVLILRWGNRARSYNLMRRRYEPKRMGVN